MKARETKIKVALACPGVGLVNRGFERFFNDLFVQLGDDFNITLFKGGGPVSKKEKVPLFLNRNGRFLKLFPLHFLIRRTPFHVECLSYAIGLLPYLIIGRYDIVHVIDPPLVRILFCIRNIFKLKFRILRSEGTGIQPCDYPPSDFTLHMNPKTHKEAVSYGFGADRNGFLPCGISSDRFNISNSREKLRKHYGISKNTFVVLQVAALNRYHKRTDYLIEEFSKLKGDVLLWLDGSMDHGDSDLPAFAMRKLGPRCRITLQSSEKIAKLYAIADVKVLASEWEGFGLVVPEALMCGCSVLVHDSAHFKWLVGSDVNLVDMSKDGELARRLEGLQADQNELDELRHPGEIANRFAWKSLHNEYVSIYETVMTRSMVCSRNGLLDPSSSKLRNK